MIETISDPVSAASIRWKHERIFGAVVAMLQKQNFEMETLIEDRLFLEDYVQLQHRQWLSKTHFLQSQVAQIKKEEEIWRQAHEKRLDLLLGLKEKELECYREHLDLLKSDLDDFCGYIESLSPQNKDLKKQIYLDKEKEREGSLTLVEKSKNNEQRTAALEGKLWKLEHEYRVLSSKKESEISSLLAEKDFIWHQFKKIDEDFTNFRKIKHVEFEQVNEAVSKLQDTIDNLQSASTEKDVIIANLRAIISDLELGSERHMEEIRKGNEKLTRVQDLEKYLEQSDEKLAIAQVDIEKLTALVNQKELTISMLKNDLIKLQSHCSQDANGISTSSEGTAPPTKLRRSSLLSPDESTCRRYRTRSDGILARQRRTSACGSSSRSSKSANTAGNPHCPISRKRSPCREKMPKLFTGNFKVPKLKDSTPFL